MKRFKRFLLTLLLSITAFSSVNLSADSAVNLYERVIGAQSFNGVTIAVNESEITVTGTASSTGIISLTDVNYTENGETPTFANLTTITLDASTDYVYSVHYVNGTAPTSGYVFLGNGVTADSYIALDTVLTQATFNTGVNTDYGLWLKVYSGTTYNYTFKLQLETGITATTPYVEYLGENEFVADFITNTGAWLTGIWVLVSSSVTASVDIFYDSTPVTGGITVIGALSLFAVSFMFVIVGLNYVKSLIKK